MMIVKMTKLSPIFLFGLVCTQVYGASSITAIKLSESEGEQQLLQIQFDGSAVKPYSFSMAEPPRLAFDFPSVGVNLSSPEIDFDSELVKSVVAVNGNERSRVLVNLGKNVSYTTALNTNTLTVKLSSDRKEVNASATPVDKTPVAPAVAAQVVEVNKPITMDFRRGLSGEGRIEVDLPTANTAADVRREGKLLVINILNAKFSREFERRLDVTDFGTPVSKIEARNLSQGGRVQIELNGDWDYSSYQTDGKLVLEVRRPLADALLALKDQKPQYKGDKLSLNFQNIEVRTVLQVIAEFTGLNIVTSDSVSGNITLRLKDVPWDQALDLILQTKGLDQRRVGNIIQIAPRDELLARDKQVQEARQQLSAIEPIRSETFVLRYRSAEDFKKILDGSEVTGKKESILSLRGSAMIDAKTNTLIVNDITSVIDKVREIIAKIDVPVKQVLIEARIVQANDDWSRNLGVRLTYDRIGSRGIISGSPLDNTISNWGNIAKGDPYVIQATPAGVQLPAPGAVGTLTTLYKAGASALIGLELTAMQAESKGRVISSPRIMTADRQAASIEQGTEIPYQEASSSGATATAFKKAVLSLNVKPQITPDNHVMLDIKVNNDVADFKKIVGGTPSLDTTQVNTQVLVENGGTVVIGGIYQQQITDVVNKVPFFGDIPLFGHLFRNSQKGNSRSELLVFITPRVVEDFRGRPTSN